MCVCLLKNFKQDVWDNVKLKFWEEAQRFKFTQHRWLKSLLIKTGNLYLAVASQDKKYGTGWRKYRQEAGRTQLWDGENLGGKILMKLRDEFAETHVWNTPTEEQDALKVYNEHRPNTWKPQIRRSTDNRPDHGSFPPPMMRMNYGGGPSKRRRQW